VSRDYDLTIGGTPTGPCPKVWKRPPNSEPKDYPMWDDFQRELEEWWANPKVVDYVDDFVGFIFTGIQQISFRDQGYRWIPEEEILRALGDDGFVEFYSESDGEFPTGEYTKCEIKDDRVIFFAWHEVESKSKTPHINHMRHYLDC